MYCNNCGAEITPNQKFCNNCGVALNPPISYTPQGQQPMQPPKMQPPVQPVQPAPGMPPVPPVNQQPAQPPMGQAPKKKPVWPIILIIVLVLLLVSFLSVWGVNKLYKSLVGKYLGSAANESHNALDIIEEQEEILDELEDQKEDMLEDFGIDDDFDFDDFMDEDLFGDLDDIPIDGNYTFKDYDYASVIQMEDYTYVENLRTVNDGTMLRPGKTLGELCDYIDSEVLEKGKKIDRDLLYDLVAVHIIDNDLVKDDDDLENNLMYCLSIANEFSGQGIRITDCMYDSSEHDNYYYDVTIGSEYDTWIVNPKEGKLFMGYGETEYSSAGDYGLFSTDTLAIWVTVIDIFYELD